MRKILFLFLCQLPGLAPAAAGMTAEEAEKQVKDFAKCYAYYNMSHFFWGSRNDRLRLEFYLERTELSYVHATGLGRQFGISEHVWANASLTHRNIMMSEIGQDLNRIPALGRTYEPQCEDLMSRIPPEVVEHYESIRHDLRNEPSI